MTHSIKDKFFFIIFQLSVAGVLFFVYAFVLQRFLPPGINSDFLHRMIASFWPLGILLAVSGAMLFIKKGHDVSSPSSKDDSFFGKPFVLLLLPMTPVVQYVVLNHNILSMAEAALLLVVFFALAFLLVFLIPLFFKPLGCRGIASVLGATLSFLLFNMPSLADYFHWHRGGSLRILVAFFSLVFLLLCLLFFKTSRKFLTTMLAALFLAGVFTSSITAFVGGERPQSEAGNRLYSLVEGRPLKKTPDIFLLTYDSYVPDETMLQYGIDNRAQEEFLLDRGFIIYRHAYSVGACTLSTMNSVLDVDTRLADTRIAVSGAGTVQRFLRESGYKTFGIFSNDYMFRGVLPSYDHFIPGITSSSPLTSIRLLLLTILEGEFRFDAGLEAEFGYHDKGEFLRVKADVLQGEEEKPRFVYTHTGPGHSQNSGRCLPDETERWEARLMKANEEMRVDVEGILNRNPDAIIIVNGDHGPYLTKNCRVLGAYSAEDIDRLDIQDRHGTFLAVRWPEASLGNIDHEEMVILQDIFPVIFAHLLEDSSVLEAKLPPVVNMDFDSRFVVFFKTLLGIPLGSGVLPHGVCVVDGLIQGGMDDGKPLFESEPRISVPPRLKDKINIERKN